jgi:long-chain alkane monooxygenase
MGGCDRLRWPQPLACDHPGTYADFAEYVVPELQRRGVYRTAYEPGTLREKLFGRGPRLRVGHPAARVRALAGQSR